jgi:hypothetical protein
MDKIVILCPIGPSAPLKLIGNRQKWHVRKKKFHARILENFSFFNGTHIISIFYNGTLVKGSKDFFFGSVP